MYDLASLRFPTHSFMRIRYTLFHCKKLFAQNHNSKYTVTSVSTAFRWALLITKSELGFRQYSFNHRTRNLRSVGTLRLMPYPLYQHAIVPFEFPRQVGWLFPLFTFNNVPLRGRYTFALSSARSSACYPPKDQPCPCEPPSHVRRDSSPSPVESLSVWKRNCGTPPSASADRAGRRS